MILIGLKFHGKSNKYQSGCSKQLKESREAINDLFDNAIISLRQRYSLDKNCCIT